MKKAMYAGSFDPFTLGHLSIVQKALEKYDKLVICIGTNPNKKPMLPAQKRQTLIIKACGDIPGAEKRIEVIVNNNLTVDVALQHGVNTLIRGIRSDSADLYAERQMAETNRLLAAARGFELQTDFIVQEDSFLQYVSSSLVRSLLNMKEYIVMARCLPLRIAQELVAREFEPLFCDLFTDYVYAAQRWTDIVETYSTRPYHNLMHLAYMFNMLEHYKKAEQNYVSRYNAKELHLAIFLHDYVYKTAKVNSQEQSGPYGNEAASVRVMQQKFFQFYLDKEINLSQAASLIMATTHAEEHLSEERALIADLDLSILGTADAAVWQEYNQAIREEYKAFSDEEYRKGRLAFLSALQKREHIFHTKFFRNLLEEQARKNLAAEISRLS